MDTLKNTLRVLLLLFATALAACLLYPVVWSSINPFFDFEPDRVFRRVWMIAVIIGLIGWGKDIGLRNPREVGFVLRKDGYFNACIGVLVAWFFLGILTFGYFTAGMWQIRADFDTLYVLKKAVEGPFKGLLIAGIEEYVFRGLIFFSLARRWGWIPAAVFSSAIFSMLHFVQGHGLNNAEGLSAWYAGFYWCGILLKSMIARFELFPAATGLFLIGMIMCYASIRTGNLWYAAGLHGGWICYFVICGAIVDYSNANPFLTGGSRLFDGVIPILGMIVVFPITWGLIQGKILRKT